MEYIIAVLFLAGCAVLILRMLTRPSLTAFHVGVLSIFSLGYYLLPIFLRSRSSLSGFSSAQVTSALGIHVLFFTAVVSGCIGVAAMIPQGRRPLELFALDALFTHHRRLTYIVCAVFYLLHFSLYRQTSYSASDFNSYFTARNPIAAVLDTISGIALAASTLAAAVEWRSGSRRAGGLMMLGVGAFVILSVSLAQRLAIITPIIMLLAALAVTRQQRLAIKALPILVVVLVVVSPLAVFLREMQIGLHGQSQAATIVSDANIGMAHLDTYVQSIVDRSDLIRNTVKLKDYVDTHGFAGPIYYGSVLAVPIPRALYHNKPYLLSNDGTMWGELSVVSWALDRGRGTIGSLTAFGGIFAYQEGGWPAIILDGLATGALFALLAAWLGEGSLSARLFYVILFPVLAVKRVPPSLFEAFADTLTVMPFIVAAIAADRIWRILPRRVIRARSLAQTR